jgi:hypothetical protein
MIRRRDLPITVAAQGLAIWSASALAQTIPDDRKQTPTAADPPTAAERVNKILAPIRDEHHLPGLLGAVIACSRPVGIGAVGVRKFGASDAITVTDQVHLGSCTSGSRRLVISLSWSRPTAEVIPLRRQATKPSSS